MDLKIEYFFISQLIPWDKNARTHSKKQIKQIVKSIEEFGWTNPILVDDEKNILAGHGRLEAAKIMELETVPCVRLSHMTREQKRAYIIADNKLAENAGWDENILALEFKALHELDVDFDLELTGFNIAEVDILIEGIEIADEEIHDDEIPEPETQNHFGVELGDIWQLGDHRLICGDALNKTSISALMTGTSAHMVFTDPPYNVPINGNVCGKGEIQHEEFAMASGEMNSDQFTSFLKKSFQNMADHSQNGSIHFVCMDWRHINEIMAAGEDIYAEIKNLIVWVKDNGGMGTFYRSRHELIFAFKHGKAAHTNTFELGQYGRYRTNVWEYKGINSAGPDRLEQLAMHPTVKPVEMIADAIKDVSPRGGIVLDVFAGSGSTLIAAEKTGRRAYLCEIDPHYCSVIIERWENYTGQEAELIHREILEAAE